MVEKPLLVFPKGRSIHLRIKFQPTNIYNVGVLDDNRMVPAWNGLSTATLKAAQIERD